MVQVENYPHAGGTRPDKRNNKGPAAPDPHTKQEETSPLSPAQTFTRVPTEKEVSTWLTPGSDAWYFAQGLTPPAEEAEKPREQGNEG